MINIYKTHDLFVVTRDAMTIMNGKFERMEEEGVTGKPRESSVSEVRNPLIFESSIPLLHSDMLLFC